MRLQRLEFVCVAAIFVVASGCAQFRKNAGGTADTDQNVLTGGPVSGTRIKDLPQPVRRVLREKAPRAEVADIAPRSQDGKLVYRIVFSEPARDPTLYIAEDGTIIENMKN
jgi:hypothetical protein